MEDDPDVRSSLHEVLERAGYEVVAAGDGREALAHLEARTTPFSLVVLDWILPILSGMDVVDWIARHPMHSPTPVVVFSGSDRVPVSQGIAAVVAKPVRRRTLIEVVDRLSGMPPRASFDTTPPPSAPTATAPTRQTARTIALRPSKE